MIKNKKSNLLEPEKKEPSLIITPEKLAELNNLLDKNFPPYYIRILMEFFNTIPRQ